MIDVNLTHPPNCDRCDGANYANWLAEATRVRQLCHAAWDAVDAALAAQTGQHVRHGKRWDAAIARYEQSRGVQLADLDSARNLAGPAGRGVSRARDAMSAAEAAHAAAVDALARVHAECSVCFDRYLADSRKRNET